MSSPVSFPLSVRTTYQAPRSPPQPMLPRHNNASTTAFERLDDEPDHHEKWKIFGMDDNVRNHIVTIIAEFLGTFMFLFFSLTAVKITNSKPDTLLRDQTTTSLSLLQIAFISFAFGTSLAVNVWLFFRVSGGMFNPAVTLGLWLAGAIPRIKVLLLVPAQLVAAICASYVVLALFPGPFEVQTTLGSGTTVVQGLFIEMMLTAQLVMSILMLAVEKHKATPLAPMLIGLTLFLDHLIGVNFTGTSVNPARTLGPAVVLRRFNTYHWIYWIGPILGSLIAVAVYKLLKHLRYHTANPGQDDDGQSVFRVVQAPNIPVVVKQPKRKSSSNTDHSFASSMSPLNTKQHLEFA